MGKKKRKKSGKGRGVGSIAGLLGAGFRFLFKTLPLLFVILIFGAVFFGVRQALYADPYLSVQKVSIHPSGSVSEKIQSHLESAWLGKNIFQVNIQMISRELERDPAIESARVIKQLPSRIHIEIKRREPAAFVRFSPKASFGLVSEDGVVLDIAEESQVSGLVVECFWMGFKELSVGQRLSIPGLRQAVQFAHAYQHTPFAREESISRIHLDHLGNVTITLGTGPQVHLGRNPMDAIPSLEKVMTLIRGEGRQKIEYIDLQFDNIIVKRKK